MLFNSITYATFLPIVVAIYWLLPQAARAAFLLVASYVFYAAWDPRYLVLIVALTIVDHRLGFWIARRRGGAPPSLRPVAAAVAVNLVALGIFKYSGFAVATIDRLATLAGLPTIPVPKLVLPLGISFFVFEFIHYVVDVSRGEAPERSFVRFALFAAFFPTQIAGPIKRYESFVPQLDADTRLDVDRLGSGLLLIARGLFKKMALADNLAPLATRGFDAVAPGVVGLRPLDAWLTLVAFAAQIYCDFSGYTDIGRGSARLLGFEVPENFRAPYLATTISEFWRRWHISLSTWLRDYVYIPLGGRVRRRDRNLLTTMVLGGLWHGASWRFAVWGAFHGAALVGYWKTPPAESRDRARAWRLASWAATVLVVLVGWSFFRANSARAGLALIADLVGRSTGAPPRFADFEQSIVVGIAGGGLALEWLVERREAILSALLPSAEARQRAAAAAASLRLAAFVLLVATALLFRPLVGVRFIYFQF
jgi:alginate O-acetyltransferase complex protein AlgI